MIIKYWSKGSNKPTILEDGTIGHGTIVHREDGPAFIVYHTKNKIASEKWYIDGVLHRSGGPVVIQYDKKDGTVQKEWWVANGLIHREDGPAEISGGTMFWWWMGRKVDQNTHGRLSLENKLDLI